MTIKVCGMKHALNIRELDTLQLADWMGFIFYPGSPRFVDQVPQYLPQYSKRVGVFVNEPTDDIVRRLHEFGLDMVQLHGDESPGYCQDLKQMFGPVPLIKAISVSSKADLRRAEAYTDIADYLLFETPCQGFGGSGHKFDWSILQAYQGPTPFLITGGIGPDDIERIRAFSHPHCIGFDLNSRFETAPAIKDIAALAAFIKVL